MQNLGGTCSSFGVFPPLKDHILLFSVVQYLTLLLCPFYSVVRLFSVARNEESGPIAALRHVWKWKLNFTLLDGRSDIMDYYNSHLLENLDEDLSKETCPLFR